MFSGSLRSAECRILARRLGKRLSDLLNIAGRIFFETHVAPLLRMQGFFDEFTLDMLTAEGERLPVLANAVERRDFEGNLLFTRFTIFKAVEWCC